MHRRGSGRRSRGRAAERRRPRAAFARAESRQAIESLLGQLGYPADSAGDLERRAWKRGHVWREVR